MDAIRRAFLLSLIDNPSQPSVACIKVTVNLLR